LKELAKAYGLLQNYTQAVEHARKAYDVAKKLYPRAHPTIYDVTLIVGESYGLVRQYNAIPYAIEGTTQAKELWGEVSVEFIRARYLLAACHFHDLSQRAHIHDSILALLKQHTLAVKKRTIHIGDSPLPVAALFGHLAAVQWLVQEGGASVKHHDSQGYTPLLRTAYSGELQTMQWLLSKAGGASIQERNKRDDTCLLMAASYGHLSMVQWLLSRDGGASIKERSNGGCTALIWAAVRGNLPVVQWLLTSGGACITEHNTHNFTCVMGAVLAGHSTVVEWLVENFEGSMRKMDKDRAMWMLKRKT